MLHHSASRARTIAGPSGFFALIECRDGPDRYSAESRFDTMPSKLILQEVRNTCKNRVHPGKSPIEEGLAHEGY